MSSNYIRPGCLDGVVGYVYNPATLPDGRTNLRHIHRSDADPYDR